MNKVQNEKGNFLKGRIGDSSANIRFDIRLTDDIQFKE